MSDVEVREDGSAVVHRPAPVGMKADEVDVVIAYLASAYMAELSDGTIFTWTDQLAHLDFETAMDAARAIVQSTRRFMPVFGEFRVEYDIAARRRAEAARDTIPALPEQSQSTASTMPTPEQAQANIEELRAVIAGAGTRDRDRAALGRRPSTSEHASREHDPRRCKACLGREDERSGSIHVHTPNADDVPPLVGDPDVPEPPPDYEL